ncbi:glycosyltransferase [Desulfonatronum thioautotrophicum]|uniref:glycosyltransferase n=1 Tax=Desulfonatronum thioautotrophicum TaxID=617001 RepID=UPI000A598CEA|nr:glycosyltransferase [Desulfonatronum thioautotrophicum]
MRINYRIIQNGLYGELDAIPTPGVLDHLRNYLGNFLLDAVVATAYLNRLGSVPQAEMTDQVKAWMNYLLCKIVRLEPFNEQARNIQMQWTGKPDPYLKALERVRLPKAVEDKLFSLNSSQEVRLRSRIIGEFLRKYPYSPPLIDQMLLLDLEQDLPPGDGWLDQRKVPPILRPLLDGQLMKYCLLHGEYGRARDILDSFSEDLDDEVWLNHAAEVYARTGDPGKAMERYQSSLQRDPLQIPVRFRLEELARPFTTDAGVMDKRIAIFLYSYNKSELLQQTLRSLAASERGNAKVVVLLNNCTDDSLAAVSAINQELFAGDIEIISLPVNIGAPAARNWLLGTEHGQNADHVAFLDDDVEVPHDWLMKLSTVLQANPDAGVAGAKTLAPGRPKRYQYLYRNVSIARDDLLRFSLDTPNFNYDSGVYDFIRPTTNVMGCCHVFTRAALDAAPWFDIRFSPSQMDDIAHDLDLCLKGFKVMYCGLMECVHHQFSGLGRMSINDNAKLGNVLGNDVKLYYQFLHHMNKLKKMNNHGIVPVVP